MEKRIVINRGDSKFLENTFNVTQMMVWNALHFRRDTMLAKKIRKAAIERGGVLIEPKTKIS